MYFLSSVERYWTGLYYEDSGFQWDSGVGYNWENFHDSDSPGGDRRGVWVVPDDSNNWRYKKHEDSSYRASALCEKDFGNHKQTS